MDTTTIIYVAYITGSLMFLAGSVIGLIQHLMQ